MRVKKVWGAAVGLACASGWAQTPDGVVLYGYLDTGVEHVTHVGAAKDGQTRMPSFTGAQPSRWGLRGSEDLGGGLRAIFTIEQGIQLDTGTLGQGGRAWGRQAFVGLTGPWGTLSFGRQYTMYFWSMLDASVLGPNIYGLASLDSYYPNARADKAIAYRGTFSGFTVGATYSLGRDAVNAGPSPAGTNCAQSPTDSKACRGASVLLKYDAKTWGISGMVDRINGGPGAFGGLTSSSLSDTRKLFAGYYKRGDIKLGAGWIDRHNEGSPTPNSRIAYVGLSVPMAPQWVFDASLERLSVDDTPNRSTLLALRGTYFLSKRTALYATAGHMRNEGLQALSVSAGGPGTAPAPGVDQTGLMLGVRHSF